MRRSLYAASSCSRTFSFLAWMRSSWPCARHWAVFSDSTACSKLLMESVRPSFHSFSMVWNNYEDNVKNLLRWSSRCSHLLEPGRHVAVVLSQLPHEVLGSIPRSGSVIGFFPQEFLHQSWGVGSCPLNGNSLGPYYMELRTSLVKCGCTISLTFRELQVSCFVILISLGYKLLVHWVNLS